MSRSSARLVLLACVGLSMPAVAQARPSDGPAAHVRLRYASFDPLLGEPAVPDALASSPRQRLCIAQFVATPTEADRTAIRALGGEVIGYLPDDAYVVRIDAGQRDALRARSAVRWVGAYHPAYRLEPELVAVRAWEQRAPVRYHVVVADKRTDKPAIVAAVSALGGAVDDEHTGSLLLTVTLTGPQLRQVAALDEVLWIDRWTPVEEDMDNARIQGGGDYLEGQSGYTGAGVNAHVYEGIEATHFDFTGGATNVQSGGAATAHGHATAGIVWGNGTSNPAVRGMAPDCGKFYTNYSSVTTGVSRWQVVDDLVNVHAVSLTSASWGNTQTTQYTAISAEADDIVFDHDITWTQSQSNTGNQSSRPQAWAKNVFSVGALYHFDNSFAGDDSWNGGASIGPAADGRIKPTLCSYFDSIATSDLTGTAGYSNASWTSNFSGTSGATPIVAGHAVLAIQMFTDDSATPGIGRFGNPLRAPGASAHTNRPHFPTLKALQVVSAEPYAFSAASNNNRREHQGWGFPNLRNLWDRRGETFVVDETRVLEQGELDVWQVTVAPNEPSLRVCLNWAEPAANPAAQMHLVNDLSLLVLAPDGTEYWGNNGLEAGVWSTPGGAEDSVNSLENVFVQNPAAGDWHVIVLATAVVQDNHTETPAVDADYGLVVVGGVAQPGSPGVYAWAQSVGRGCDGTRCLPAIYEFPGFDLANSGFTLDYENGDYALVAGQGTWIPPAGTNLGLGNNGESLINVGFTLPFPGGQTGTLRVSSNGWIANNSFVGQTSITPSPADFLQNTMWAGLWNDLNPASSGSVWFDSTASRAVVTWVGVPSFPNNGASTFQIQFWNGGDVHFVYQTVNATGDILVGFTNAGAADPGSTDISQSLLAGLGVCTNPVPEMSLSASARPVVGTTFDLVADDVPPNTLFALALLGVVGFDPGINLTFLGMPGCELYQTLDAVVLFATNAGTGSLSWPVPPDPTLAGTAVFAQVASVTPGINPFDLAVSNGLRITVGLN